MVIYGFELLSYLCTLSLPCVLLHNDLLKCMYDLSPCKKGNTRLMKLLGRLSYEQIQRCNNSPPYVASGIATGGSRGQSVPLTGKKLPIITKNWGKEGGKLGKRGKKSGKRGKIGKKRQGSFTLPPPPHR